MKIKIDHVTNSSSEVFGVVLADSAVVAGLMFMLDSVVTGMKASAPMAKSSGMPEEFMRITEEAASRVTEGVLSDAREQEKIVKAAYAHALDPLNKAASALKAEAAKIQKEWEAYSKTADQSSSDFLSRQQKNNEYLSYLRAQLKQVDLMKHEVEQDKQKTNALINERDAWVQQNQADFVTVQEQRALLDSLSASFKLAESDENPWLKAYQELERRETDIDKALSSVNARLEYKAIARGEFKPNPETISLMKQLEELTRKLEADLAQATEVDQKKLRQAYDKQVLGIKDAVLKANKAELATKASEGLQYGADVAIDGLAELAGPAGAQLKIAYTAIKTLALGAKDAKKDPKNKAKHLAKAILNVSANAIKDQLGDIPYAKESTTILSNVLQSGLSASIAGTSTAEAIGTSLTKGVFDLGAEKGIAALKEATDTEKKASDEKVIPLSVTEVLNDNPLTDQLNLKLKKTLIFE